MQPELKATGSVSIVMVLSLKRFIQEDAPTSLAQRLRRLLLAMLGRWLPQRTSAMARFVLAVPSALADLVSINWLDETTLNGWLGNILWLFQGIDGGRFTATARLIELLGLLLLIVLLIVWRLRTGRRF